MAKLLLLTGQRLNEVAQMVDSEIQGDWCHLGSARTKNARAHDVPLSGAALVVLEAKAHIKSKAGYNLFTTTGESPCKACTRAGNA